MTSSAFVPFGRLDTASPKAFLKAIRMVAACWGCNYEGDREFVTRWERCDDCGDMQLVDVADNGAYSMQVEGLYSRYLLGWFGIKPPHVPNILLGGSESPRIESIFPRTDWDPSLASEQDWDALRRAIQEVGHSNGGFYSGDVAYAELAIDRLRAGERCIASTCNRLGDEQRSYIFD